MPTKKFKFIRGGHFEFQQNLENITCTSPYCGECELFLTSSFRARVICTASEPNSQKLYVTIDQLYYLPDVTDAAEASGSDVVWFGIYKNVNLIQLK